MLLYKKNYRSIFGLYSTLFALCRQKAIIIEIPSYSTVCLDCVLVRKPVKPKWSLVGRVGGGGRVETAVLIPAAADLHDNSIYTTRKEQPFIKTLMISMALLLRFVTL
jgi:hypothetical protein